MPDTNAPAAGTEAAPSGSFLEQMANPESYGELAKTFIEMGQSLLLCIFILILGWIASKWANKIVSRMLEKRKADVAISRFMAGIAQYLVLAAAVIAALGAVGIETTSLVALLGSAGIAVGLALQGNLSHFASGVMILFFRPFTIGDMITAGGQTGVVEDIGLFATTMHTPDNQKIIIPNGAVTGGSIVNMTTLGTRRAAVDVGVAYGSDVEQVIGILTKAAQRTDLALSEPGAAVAFVGLGASSLDFTVMAWCKSEDYLGLLHNLRTSIYDDLNAAGVDIPFNQIVVHQAS